MVCIAGRSPYTKRIAESSALPDPRSASRLARLPTDTPWRLAYAARLSPLPAHPDTNRSFSFSL